MNIKVRTLFSILTTLFLTLVIATTALAGSWGFKGGFGSGSPILKITEGSYIYGVGGADFTLVMTAYADVVGMCENNGGNIAIGRGEVEVSTSASFDLFLDKNGKIVFGPDQVVVEVTADDLNAVSPHPKRLGCPNNGFTVTGIYDAKFTSVNLSGFDGKKTLFSYDFDCYYSGDTLKGCW